MTPQDFAFLARMLKLRCGLAVVPNKRFLLETRLGPVIRGNGFTDVSELVSALRRASDDALLAQVTATLAAEDVFFFRDSAPFEHLAAHMVSEALRQGAAARGLLRIWSAGCGTGQEPYSIAMRLLETRETFGGCGLEIVATDRSEPALKTAGQGRYTQFEVQRGLPIALLLKYFHKVGWHWQIDDAVRALVSFGQHDLLEPDERLGAFDIIFCRNVLLCLDAAARVQALEHLAAHLRPGGFLVLGLAETAAGAGSAFAPVPGQRGVFVYGEESRPVPARRKQGVVLALMNVAFYLAIDRLPLGTVGAIEFLGPIGLAAWGMRSPRNWLALALAIGGVYVLTDVRIESEPLGYVFAFANCALFMLYVVLGHRIAASGGGVDGLAAAMLVAMVAAFPIGIGEATPTFLDPVLLAAAIGVGVSSSVVPYVCDQLAMAKLPRATFALLLALLPATATLIGVLVLRQIPTPAEMFGVGLVIAGVALHRIEQPPAAPV